MKRNITAEIQKSRCGGGKLRTVLNLSGGGGILLFQKGCRDRKENHRIEREKTVILCAEQQHGSPVVAEPWESQSQDFFSASAQKTRRQKQKHQIAAPDRPDPSEQRRIQKKVDQESAVEAGERFLRKSGQFIIEFRGRRPDDLRLPRGCPKSALRRRPDGLEKK